MSDKTKTIGLIGKLEKAFPKAELIAIRAHFNKHNHNKTVNIYYEAYIEGVGHESEIPGINGLEVYVDRMIKFHQEV